MSERNAISFLYNAVKAAISYFRKHRAVQGCSFPPLGPLLFCQF